MGKINSRQFPVDILIARQDPGAMRWQAPAAPVRTEMMRIELIRENGPPRVPGGTADRRGWAIELIVIRLASVSAAISPFYTFQQRPIRSNRRLS